MKIKTFDYQALENELGEFHKWKKFDGMPVEFSQERRSYIIVGVENPVRMIERQWIKIKEV